MEKELYCDCCDDFVSFNVIKKEEVYKVKDKEITVTSNIPFCNICGEKLYYEKLEKENLERAYKVYREEMGILFTGEIKDISEMYGLNQRLFSKILKWGEINDRDRNIDELMSRETVFRDMFKNKANFIYS